MHFIPEAILKFTLDCIHYVYTLKCVLKRQKTQKRGFFADIHILFFDLMTFHSIFSNGMHLIRRVAKPPMWKIEMVLPMLTSTDTHKQTIEVKNE